MNRDVIGRNFNVAQLEQAVGSAIFCTIEGTGSTAKYLFKKVDELKATQAAALLKDFNIFADVGCGLNFNNLTCTPIDRLPLPGNRS